MVTLSETVQQLLVSSGGLEKLMLIYDAPNPDAELASVISSILVMLTAFNCKLIECHSRVKLILISAKSDLPCGPAQGGPALPA
jgi:hypothetical protein